MQRDVHLMAMTRMFIQRANNVTLMVETTITIPLHARACMTYSAARAAPTMDLDLDTDVVAVVVDVAMEHLGRLE